MGHKTYFLASVEGMSGVANLRTANDAAVDSSSAWQIGGAYGFVFAQKDERRFMGELRLGYRHEKRNTADDKKLSSSTFLMGTKLLYEGPYNEYFGWGAQATFHLKFSVPTKDFLKAPSRYLVSIGPVISQDIGFEKPSELRWQPALWFNSKEVYFALGLDMIF
ncbi:MAG: hypothetical protein ABIR96_06680 [Bdellovibrionota bacterium]